MNKSKKPIAIAVVLIAAGIFILLNNLGVFQTAIPDYVFTWKALLIAFGTLGLLRRNWFGGFAMIGVGAYFLIPEIYHIPHLDVEKLWPVILIYLGIIVLLYYFFPPKNRFSKFRRKLEKHKRYKEYYKEFKEFKDYKENKAPHENSDFTENTVILGGDFKKISSFNFKGGKLNSIMGGMELDLTNCCLSNEQNIIDIAIIMGGLTLIVPKEWNVIIEASPIIMGGIFDENDSFIDPAAQIIIRGSVVMGGVEIKRAS